MLVVNCVCWALEGNGALLVRERVGGRAVVFPNWMQ